MNSASPLFSPLLLAVEPAPPANASAPVEPTTENDGVLETREIMNLDLRAAVAVLSDGAATSMRDSAPAADTIRWAWRAAGVPSIVMSRWAGDDAATAAMFGEFYKRLKAGETAGKRAAGSAHRTARARRDPCAVLLGGLDGDWEIKF